MMTITKLISSSLFHVLHAYYMNQALHILSYLIFMRVLQNKYCHCHFRSEDSLREVKQLSQGYRVGKQQRETGIL